MIIEIEKKRYVWYPGCPVGQWDVNLWKAIDNSVSISVVSLREAFGRKLMVKKNGIGSTEK